MSNVLIVGGNGLVGSQLQKKLLEKGFSVSILGRSKSNRNNVKSYLWNLDENQIDEEAITSADYIINLAGAGIADKRWSNRRKNELIASRVDSTKLLLKTIRKTNSKPKAYISASAIGYYGGNTSDKIFSEQDPPSIDFLSTCCINWEDASKEITEINVRRVILRIGIVLSAKGGALKKMIPTFNLGLGSAIGNGKQYIPWIHIDDLCNCFIKAIEDDQIAGAYNAVSPYPETNKNFSAILAKALHKPFWLPAIPNFIIRILLGEMAVLLTDGNQISAKKIISTGFKFKYPKLERALEDLLKK